MRGQLSSGEACKVGGSVKPAAEYFCLLPGQQHLLQLPLLLLLPLPSQTACTIFSSQYIPCMMGCEYISRHQSTGYKSMTEVWLDGCRRGAP